jgi:hypothetical protein
VQPIFRSGALNAALVPEFQFLGSGSGREAQGLDRTQVPNMKASRFSQISAIIVSLVIAFVVANALAEFGLFLWERTKGVLPAASDRNPWLDRYGYPLLSQIYPGRSEAEINDLLNETYSIRTMYQPFAQFRTAPVSGKYLNVRDPGYRSIGAGQAQWPPPAGVNSIFLFGGSTAFGAGVPDNETVAAYLQANLRNVGMAANVYNFGTGSHLSSSERGLFEFLISAGHVPGSRGCPRTDRDG